MADAQIIWSGKTSPHQVQAKAVGLVLYAQAPGIVSDYPESVAYSGYQRVL